MSDSAAAGGGGGDKIPSNEKSNDKSTKVDYRKNVKCNFGAKCSKDPCPFKHSPTHVPYVKPVVEGVVNSAPKNCRYDTNCHNTRCKFNHSEGYSPHPIARCKFGADCDWVDDDIDDNDKCNYSHPDDEWWADLTPVPNPTSFSAGRGRGGAIGGRGRGGRGRGGATRGRGNSSGGGGGSDD
jgi:uncharacterized membrane protein YgcG